MDTALLMALMLALGLGTGLLMAHASYALELRRMARWLHERDTGSNARLTVNAPGPGLRELADAVNTELDREQAARVAALRHQQEFQRDLSALSHDIRTPLTGAKGYLQLAAEEADEETRRERLDAATARIDSTCALLDQLFSYTKATDPDLSLDIRPVAVRPLVEQALLGHFPEFEERGWEPELRFADDAIEVEADSEALMRVFENLVVNALRYGSGALAVEQREGALTFSNPVADPDAVDAGRLFERFYQGDSARGGAGAGLGLSVAAKLAEAMGMRLSAHLDGNVLSIMLSW